MGESYYVGTYSTVRDTTVLFLHFAHEVLGTLQKLIKNSFSFLLNSKAVGVLLLSFFSLKQ